MRERKAFGKAVLLIGINLFEFQHVGQVPNGGCTSDTCAYVADS